MKFIIIFLILNFININKFNYIQKFDTNCNNVEENINMQTFSSNNSVSYEFSGNATPSYIGTQVGNVFQYYGKTNYFSFYSNSTQYIKLNYMGPSASLTVYDYYHYSNNDYLVQIDDITMEEDILYLDINKTYIFEFKSKSSSLSNMYFTPLKLNSSLQNHENYILNILFDSSSFFGYHYKVEYFDVSLTESMNTISCINTTGGVTSHLDLLDENINFNINNDNRRLVENPGNLQYSSISYAETLFSFYNDDMLDSSYIGRGTGTFIDETTVISCAHLFYNQKKDENKNIINSCLINNVDFYPGANTFYDSNNWYSTFGKYTAYNSYVPISYLLFDSGRNQYDWSISLTSNTIIGEKTHSYMGLFNFTSTASSNEISSNQIQSSGYPALYNNSNIYYKKTMWSSYPLLNTIYGEYNTLYSNDIVCSGGNSGGPLYVFTSALYNGQVIHTSNLIGILVAVSIDSEQNFVMSYSCRMRPLIINIYKEVIK